MFVDRPISKLFKIFSCFKNKISRNGLIGLFCRCKKIFLIIMKVSLARFVSIFNFFIKTSSFTATVPYSVLNTEILFLLWRSGLISSFFVEYNQIVVYLKYHDGHSAIKQIKFLPNLNKHLFAKRKYLEKTLSKQNITGFFVMSSPSGLVTSSESILFKSNFLGHIVLEIVI